MTAETVAKCDETAANSGGDCALLHANRLADSIKRRWYLEKRPDLRGALAAHPELRRHRTVVLDLAYTEYRVRQETGEPLEAKAFSQQFPSLQRSLYLLIEVQSLLSQDPELQALQENISWPEAGQRFLQFDLVAEIGRGTFGRVFLATEPALGNRQIVVKVAPSAEGEAEILGRLRHPNIVPIYSIHEDKSTGLVALCMPYMGTITLGNALDQIFGDRAPPLSVGVLLGAAASSDGVIDPHDVMPPLKNCRGGAYVDGILHLAVQLTDALAHAHQYGICHRDLKPSNVLITADGRPMLLDFNLSVDVDLPTWKVGGTLPYMAPEELVRLMEREDTSRVRRYDFRSDLFSLGVVIYEALTGRYPFGEVPWTGSLQEVACQLRQRQATGPEPIRQWNKQVDSHLAQLIERCLAFEPDDRPETAQQLATEFRRELSPVRRARRWIGNHCILAATFATAFLSLAIVACLVLVLRPSYGVRQFHLGLAQMDRGEYSMAVTYLTDSLRDSPNFIEARLKRAFAYQHQKQFGLAYEDYLLVEDFFLARKLPPRPIIKACMGYCLSQLGRHEAAVSAYRSALAQGYEFPALLHNNIGFSCFAIGQFSEAKSGLLEAIQIDDSLQAAHYTMMMVLLNHTQPGEQIPKAAFSHAARAIELGPPTGGLYHGVATLYAIAARQDASLVPMAIEFVEKAVEYGVNKSIFEMQSTYSALQGEASFHSALRKPTLTHELKNVVQLIDPLEMQARGH